MANKKSAIDTAMIRQLAELLAETDLSEIEIEEDDLRIRLARGTASFVAPMPVAHAPAPMAAPAAPATPAAPEVAQTPAAEQKSSDEPVTSPMVGTAYHSPAPGAEPFVRVGQKVSKGQTIMIVEAMKTMNQSPSPADGTVKSICVEDGQPVEYGEALVLLD